MAMKQISQHIYQIPLGPVNVFLIEDNGLTLIDTGFEKSKDKIFQAIRNGGKDPKDIRQIILTHSHPDHAGSVADISRTVNAPVCAHTYDAALVEAGVGGRLPHQLGPGLLNNVLYRLFIKNSKNETEVCRVQNRVDDGNVIDIAGGIRVIHTPGHSLGHIALLIEQEGVLIAGDICQNMLGLSYSTVYENIETGRQSILKAAGYDFETAVFGHGSPLKGQANQKLKQIFINHKP
jgi:glyoxylase-like metal-dependent hydrolase (beta-lactamase superfamily II)